MPRVAELERAACVDWTARQFNKRAPFPLVVASMKGHRILAAAGIVSAVVSFVGGTVYQSPLMIGIASGIMLLGNVAALLVPK